MNLYRFIKNHTKIFPIYHGQSHTITKNGGEIISIYTDIQDRYIVYNPHAHTEIHIAYTHDVYMHVHTTISIHTYIYTVYPWRKIYTQIPAKPTSPIFTFNAQT